ncbi:hypothetical protein M6D81_14080 [Paenibacillus sp. J5C_2022]|uniref:hypothetical protein n=1 Tax=Paenibacillus sp. J5C2022 TaxID=2977129 RepID=UPI0021D33CB8|nr:hypothetical protein [Paenibacillus sp. J5C2022]MCU6709819.1 hypothetical protein [Paenibacillus sp. J5C2022]
MMKKNAVKAAAACALALALTIGVGAQWNGYGNVANAAEKEGSDQAASVNPANPQAGTKEDGGKLQHHPGKHGKHGVMMGGKMNVMMDGVAEALGMTHEELRTSLRDGKTIASLAEEKGVDLEMIVEAHISKIEAKLQEAVEAGKLTEEDMQQKLEGAREHVQKLVNGELPLRAGGKHGMKRDCTDGQDGQASTDEAAA